MSEVEVTGNEAAPTRQAGAAGGDVLNDRLQDPLAASTLGRPAAGGAAPRRPASSGVGSLGASILGRAAAGLAGAAGVVAPGGVSAGGPAAAAQESALTGNAKGAAAHRAFGVSKRDGALEGPAPAPTPTPSATFGTVVSAHPKEKPLKSAAPPRMATLLPHSPSGTIVHSYSSTTDAPVVERDRVPDALFLPGGPTAQDVSQNAIGNCGQMALISTIAEKDPKHIEKLMSASGGKVTTTLYATEDGKSFTPVRIVQDDTLAENPYGAGNQRLGAQHRVAKEPDPAFTAWSAEVAPQMQSAGVTKHERYAAAMWVAYLEKALARLLEKYGKYGGQAGRGADALKGKAGYDMLAGGDVAVMSRVFYGMEATDVSVVQTDADGPTAGLVAKNQAALRRLVGAAESAKDAEKDGRAELLVAWSPGNAMFARMRPVIDEALGARDLPAPLVKDLEGLKGMIAPLGKDAKPPFPEPLVELVTRLAAPQKTPALHADEASRTARALGEQLMYARITMGYQSGKRPDFDAGNWVYGMHAYGVMGVAFRDAKGGSLPLTRASPDADLLRVDGSRSEVRLRNPVQKAEPSRGGIGKPDDKRADGAFTISVDQFLRSFEKVEAATVPKGGGASGGGSKG